MDGGGANHLSSGATYDAAGDLSAWQPPDSIWTYNLTYAVFGEVTEGGLSTDSTPREHHTAGGMSRTLPHLADLQPELFAELQPELAAEASVENADAVHRHGASGAHS